MGRTADTIHTTSDELTTMVERYDWLEVTGNEHVDARVTLSIDGERIRIESESGMTISEHYG